MVFVRVGNSAMRISLMKTVNGLVGCQHSLVGVSLVLLPVVGFHGVGVAGRKDVGGRIGRNECGGCTRR